MMNSSDSAARFGDVRPLPESPWGRPPVFPVPGRHPRVLFAACDLPRLRKEAAHPENRFALRRMMELARTTADGCLPPPGQEGHNMDHGVLAVIEAKAFLYALKKETALAEEAVRAVLNFMASLEIPEGTYPDSCRAFGYVMYIAACVYDWCYDALGPEEKRRIVAGCENLLAPHFEIGMPPVGQGSFVGHGTEAQLLRDWLALSIAAYDEYPSLYACVGGRIFNDYVPSAEAYLRSGAHWQGSAYGPYRMYFLLFAQHLAAHAFGRETELFSPRLHDAALSFLHMLRPDGQALRIGDDFNEYGNHYDLICYAVLSFLAASFYHDPCLKGFSGKCLQDFSVFSYANNALSPVMFLIFNWPNIPRTGLESLPKSVYFGSPLGACIARTAWGDPEASMIYIKIGEGYTANHEHRDAGSFQLYSRGILASNSGTYDSYFTPHDRAYNKQTISVNSLLIVRPNRQEEGPWPDSGGQVIGEETLREHPSAVSWLASPVSRQAKVLARAVGSHCCCLWGDITRAYDPETAEKVVRRMLAVFPEDKVRPLVFAVYDEIVSTDASFRKIFLLHCQQEPRVTPEGIILVENTRGKNHGRLVVQSCGEETEVTLIPGCSVNGRETSLQRQYGPDSVCEMGWGRIELSPRHPARQNRLLTLMYADDSLLREAPVQARPIRTGRLTGAALPGCVVLFCQGNEPLREEEAFACPGQGAHRVYLCGAAAGVWRILQNGMETARIRVKPEEMLLVFTAAPGTVTLRPGDGGEENP